MRQVYSSPAIPSDGLAFGDFEVLRDGAVTEADRVAGCRTDAGARELPLLPLKIDLKTAARPQAFDAAGRPGRGQRGQQLDFEGRIPAAVRRGSAAASRRCRRRRRNCRRSGTADARRTCSDRCARARSRCWMMLKARSPSCSRAQQLIRQAMAQPVVLSPRVFSVLLAAAASSGVSRGVIWRAGIESVEMRHVAMMLFPGLHVPILQPFLQLAGFADLVGRQPGASVAASCCGSRRRCSESSEALMQLANRSRRICVSIVGPAQTDGAERMPVFRRKRGIGDQPFVLGFLHKVSRKNCAAPFRTG